MTYAGLDLRAWEQFVDVLRPAVRAAKSIEEAAQRVTKELHGSLPATTALARIYATLPCRELPPDVASFVAGLATKHGHAVLPPTTPVLALLGTWGADLAWQHRSRSQGHKAIPLVSTSFVDAIPMLARLLRELGLDLAALDSAPEVATRRMLGGFNGLFYVEDARTARDAKGRLVIPAVDFVARERIQTVFGLGGVYPDGTLVVCIVFTRERITRARVEQLTSLLSMFKGETFGLVLARRLYAPA